MKIVKIDAEIPDKSGLFFDLVKAEFEVRNVSGEKEITYIVLEDEEEKDPLPIADLWIGKAVENTSTSLMKERRKIHEKFVQGKAARIAALRIRTNYPENTYAYESGGEDGVQVLTMEPAQSESWFSKLRKLW